MISLIQRWFISRLFFFNNPIIASSGMAKIRNSSHAKGLTEFVFTNLILMGIGSCVATFVHSSAEIGNHSQGVTQSKIFSFISKPGA